jgi:hypothetical protein
MRALTLLSLLLLPVVASAGDVPRRMTWHGRLARTDGTPETNPQSLKFALYASPSGGSPLWEETLQNVPVSNGYYAVVLGQATPLPLTALNGQDLYLGLALNGGAEQQPRVRVASVPYALKASDAHTLDGRQAADFALTAHGHADATTSAPGFMSAADKSKLDGLNTTGFAATSHSHANATTSAPGFMSAADKSKLDGLNTTNFAATSHSHVNATTSASGFMSSADKSKLDGLNSANYAPVNHTHTTPNPICVYRRETRPGTQVATVLCNTNEAMMGGGCAMDTGTAEGGVEQDFSGMTATASGTGGMGMVCRGRGGGGNVVQAWVTCCRWP